MEKLDAKTLTEQVQVINGVARLKKNGADQNLDVIELPEKFIRWQLDYKHSIYDAIEQDQYIAFNAGHLPVVATWADDALVPNLANKGVGFTPKDEYIDYYLELVEDAVAQIQELPPHAVNETRDLRIRTARELYSHPEHIDWRRVGLLEIFEGSTLKNLVENPFASVLWTGNSPVFVSFQADCVVEIIEPEDKRYRFPWAMRRLFEYEPFHVVQTIYPYSYCFWIYRWKDKTPKRRYPGKRSDNTVNEAGGVIDKQAFNGQGRA
ncbi:MAG: hypothetical protein F4Y00_09280 [Bacteroidetes bacterium SB0662_bin_6]|nr:hypothetical protein [Bacteroidetes bacterium SB0668_bin_1]MYE05145.1 hypothetical protein [Bacteroidetes bacterium SB0662_bin_6]